MYTLICISSVFVMMRVFEWVSREGGLTEMQKRSLDKATLIYNVIEQSQGFYVCPVQPAVRSRTNLPFRLAGGPELEAQFLLEAKQQNMIQLKGHR